MGGTKSMAAYRLRNSWVKMRSKPIIRFIPALQRKLRFQITPYYVILEELGTKNRPPINAELESHEITSFDNRDMKQMAAIPDRRFSEEELIARLKEEKKCYGVKIAGQIAAFTWVDLKEFGMSCSRSLLKKHEAYLFDAYTLPAFRGKGLAPLVRFYAYEQLEKMGKKTLYSITDFFNVPSMRFKAKLGARTIEMRLLFWAFKRRIFDMRLKKYSQA
jgi:GNAT superfamily N-acetyltransferase